MRRLLSNKFQIFPLITLSILMFFVSSTSHAAQDAMVLAEQAVVYADAQMSAPVGYIKKGKKIKVGTISRNRSQVYPIIVSGKVAYIRVIDVTTETTGVDSKRLVAERFQRATENSQKTNYGVSLFNYASQVTIKQDNATLKNKDAFNWIGVSLHGGMSLNPKWDLDILLNYMSGTAESEGFKAVEFGAGGAYRLVDSSRFVLKVFGQFLIIPFASYTVGDDFRVNGYGYSMGGGMNAVYRFANNLGIEAFGGFYLTKLSGFKPPAPYNKISPSFIGNRVGLGLNYQF